MSETVCFSCICVHVEYVTQYVEVKESENIFFLSHMQNEKLLLKCIFFTSKMQRHVLEAYASVFSLRRLCFFEEVFRRASVRSHEEKACLCKVPAHVAL